MYVNSGLLLAVKNGAELAGVLAHEMGHVTARHVAQEREQAARHRLRRAASSTSRSRSSPAIPYLANAGGMAGSVAGQAFISIVHARRRARGRRARRRDAWCNAGWNPEGMVTMFETLQAGGRRRRRPAVSLVAPRDRRADRERRARHPEIPRLGQAAPGRPEAPDHPGAPEAHPRHGPREGGQERGATKRTTRTSSAYNSPPAGLRGGRRDILGRPSTLGELRASGYRPRSVREELRANLIARLRAKQPFLPEMIGYADSVIPALEHALLAGHDMIFLGERGQGKSKMIRKLVELLDDAVPVIANSEVNDDPLAPISRWGREQVEKHGDAHGGRLDRPRRALRREARHPRRLGRGPDRRDRPDPGRRRPLSRRRVDHPLRADPAHQPRHLLHQRAARPGGEGPGGALQRDGGARLPGEGLQGAAAARRAGRGQRQPRGLHPPRPHHHAAEGPLPGADPHPLPAHPRARDRRHEAGAPQAARGGGRALRAATSSSRSSPS